MILINGEPREAIAATDRGLHYGDGVFETIAINNGKPRFWPMHMERLLDGCARLDIPLPDLTTLENETAWLCGENKKAVLKIIITRGSGGRGYRAPAAPEPSRIIMRYPWPNHAVPQQGITLRQCRTVLACNPSLAGIKHLNRLEQVLARNEWDDDTVQEGVMCSSAGDVIEGTMSNLFAVRDGRLLTPDLSHCGIDGIMRRQVLGLAEELALTCDVARIPPSELQAMDELFMTNSIIGIWPVACYEGHAFAKGRVTARLMNALDVLMSDIDA